MTFCTSVSWRRRRKLEIITIWHIADKYLRMRRKYSPKNMVCTLHIYFIYLLVVRYLFPLLLLPFFPLLLLLVFIFALFCYLIFYISSLSPFLFFHSSVFYHTRAKIIWQSVYYWSIVSWHMYRSVIFIFIFILIFLFTFIF